MALHNEGDWWMDSYNHEPVRARDYMNPSTTLIVIPELCNAIQITGQMPSRFYIIPFDVHLSAKISA